MLFLSKVALLRNGLIFGCAVARVWTLNTTVPRMHSPRLPALRLTEWRLVKQGNGELRNGSYVSWGSQSKLGIACASPADSICLLLERRERGRVILWLNMATAMRDGKRVRAGASDGGDCWDSLGESSSPGRSSSANPQSHLPPPLNNAHTLSTVMLKSSPVRHVSFCVSRAEGESVPERKAFVITKDLMTHRPLLFWWGYWGKEG